MRTHPRAVGKDLWAGGTSEREAENVSTWQPVRCAGQRRGGVAAPRCST